MAGYGDLDPLSAGNFTGLGEPTRGEHWLGLVAGLLGPNWGGPGMEMLLNELQHNRIQRGKALIGQGLVAGYQAGLPGNLAAVAAPVTSGMTNPQPIGQSASPEEAGVSPVGPYEGRYATEEAPVHITPIAPPAETVPTAAPTATSGTGGEPAQAALLQALLAPPNLTPPEGLSPADARAWQYGTILGRHQRLQEVSESAQLMKALGAGGGLTPYQAMTLGLRITEMNRGKMDAVSIRQRYLEDPTNPDNIRAMRALESTEQGKMDRAVAQGTAIAGGKFEVKKDQPIGVVQPNVRWVRRGVVEQLPDDTALGEAVKQGVAVTPQEFSILRRLSSAQDVVRQLRDDPDALNLLVKSSGHPFTDFIKTWYQHKIGVGKLGTAEAQKLRNLETLLTVELAGPVSGMNRLPIAELTALKESLTGLTSQTREGARESLSQADDLIKELIRIGTGQTDSPNALNVPNPDLLNRYKQ